MAPLKFQVAWAVMHMVVHSFHLGLSPLFTPETLDAIYMVALSLKRRAA